MYEVWHRPEESTFHVFDGWTNKQQEQLTSHQPVNLSGGQSRSPLGSYNNKDKETSSTPSVENFYHKWAEGMNSFNCLLTTQRTESLNNLSPNDSI